MTNLHARELEKILNERGIFITKTPTVWTITHARSVHYAPNTGACWYWTPGTESRKREQLRGSAYRIAEIIEALVR